MAKKKSLKTKSKVAVKKTAAKKSPKKAAKKTAKKAAKKTAKKMTKKAPKKAAPVAATLPASVPQPIVAFSTGSAEFALKIGQMAPAFTAPDQDGKLVSLASLKGKTVVLYFYPKDLTPGCTQESCDFRDHHTKFLAKGAVVFGVSKDSQASHRKFIATHKLPFALLSDESGKMLEAYGVWKEKSMYGRKYMGIERTTVVIAADGRIRSVFAKVSVPQHVSTVLSQL